MIKKLIKPTIWWFKFAWKTNKPLLIWHLFTILFTQLRPIIANLIIALTLNNITNGVVVNWYIIGSLAVGIEIGNIIASSYNTSYKGHFQALLSLEFEKQFLKQSTRLSLLQLENTRVSNNKQLIDESYNYILQQTSFIIPQILASLVFIITTSIILFPKYPLYTTLLLVIAILRGYIYSNKAHQRFKALKETSPLIRKAYATMSYINVISKQIEIRLMKATKFFMSKFANLKQKALSIRQKVHQQTMIYDTPLGMLSKIITLIFIWQLIILAINKQINIGDITFYYNNLTQFSGKLITIMGLFGSLSSIINILDIIENFFNLKSDMPKGNIKIKLSASPTIQIKNLSFKYPNQKHYALKDINLTINPKEKIAIVGENGAGKTTLIKLILRLILPSKGAIHINNYNLKEIIATSWWKHISVIQQDFSRFPAYTAHENIAISNIKEINDQEHVIKSAQKAKAHEFISKLPNKYDTILTSQFENGVNLSTGQWQKIAIARMFFVDKEIYILDEPTASIDPISEAQIFNNIYQTIKNKTVIIISHRYNTIQAADKIIVLHKGKIAEQGTHDQLMKLNGLYSQGYKKSQQTKVLH